MAGLNFGGTGAESFDVIVVGGGYAGVSAALQLAGTGRRTAVVDSGVARNAGIEDARGVFGFAERPPADILAQGRAQLRLHSNIHWVSAAATDVNADDKNRFELNLDDGSRLMGRRIVLAGGVADELPATPGLAERWKTSVFHCPYCNGHKVAGGRIGVVASGPASVALAMLVRDWGTTMLFIDGAIELGGEDRQRLAARGVAIEPARVTEVVGKADLRLADGRRIALDGIFVNTKTRIRGDLAEQLGCTFGEGASGPILVTDDQCETSVAGVFACGDIMRSSGKIALAIGDGSRAGIAAHQSLIFR